MIKRGSNHSKASFLCEPLQCKLLTYCLIISGLFPTFDTFFFITTKLQVTTPVIRKYNFAMVDMEESFTERILRRASLKKQRDGNTSLNSSKEMSQRRYNILRAINEPSSRRGSCIGLNESQKFDQSCDFSRDSFDLTGISCNNNNNDENSVNAYKTIDKEFQKLSSKQTKLFELETSKSVDKSKTEVDLKPINLAQPKSCSTGNSFVNEDNFQEEPAALPKMIRNKINSSPKKTPESEPTKHNKVNTDFHFGFTKTESLRLPIVSAIDDSDPESEVQDQKAKNTFTTQAVIEMCNRVYTALDSNYETPNNQNFKMNEETASKNWKNSFRDSNFSVNFIKSETEAATLEYAEKLTHSDPRKTLFPIVSEVLSIGSTSSDKKSDDDSESASILNETAPYDEERFLAEALGDELYKMSETYDDTYARNRTHSDFTASDLMTEDSFPLQKRVMQALNLPSSEPSSPKSSSTLNRSMRIYRSLSQRIKKKFRPVLKAKKDLNLTPTIPSGSEEIDMIQDLLQEVKVQQTWMNQAAKALHSSTWKEDHLGSSQRVESERLLLVASLRRKAALEAIKGITSDEERKDSGESFREKAEVTISDISLHLRDSFSPESRDGEMVEWFVVTVAHGLNVWATPAIRCSPNERRLKFKESISIANLTPGFKIIVEVYSLRIVRENSREERHRISKQSRSTSCLPYSSILASPTKLFKKIESPGVDDHNAWKSRNSSFVLSGFAELFLKDLTSSSPWSLMLVPANSALSGLVDLNLACRLHLAMSHEGFLNFYEDIGGFSTWNRRWCVLKGHTLMFWNYPREQDVKEPLKVIELVACVSNEITTVDRTICPKPRTLLIETERSRIAGDRNSMTVECTSTSTFVRNLLSFDTAQELEEWSEKLNHVLLALEEWNIIGQRTQVQVSEL